MLNPYRSDATLLNWTAYLHDQRNFILASRMIKVVAEALGKRFQPHNTRINMKIVLEETNIVAAFGNKKFAQLSLDVSREAELTAWVTGEGIQVWDLLTNLLNDGYKVSLVWVYKQSSFCVSIMGTDDSKHNQDAILTSWSDDLEDALLIGGFKHYVICDGGKWPLQDTSRRWG